MKQEASLVDATSYLGKWLDVIVDKPMGSQHPSGEPIYTLNYGYVPDTVAGDGSEQDVYNYRCD